MSRFALKLAIFSLAIILSHVIFYLALPIDPDNPSYLATINDKFARLNNTSAPRIIFVGTSDLAFGLDSAKIEDAFGLPVVNMGLNGALGIRFSLESIRHDIEPGDIIVVSANLEDMPDNLFYGQDDGTGAHLWLLKFRPSAIRALNTPAYMSLLPKEYDSFVKTMLRLAVATKLQDFYLIAPRVPEIPYRRSGFNEYGDLIAHLELSPIPFALPPLARPAPAGQPSIADAVGMERAAAGNHLQSGGVVTAADAYFNDFHKFVLARGARLYAISPPTLPALTQLHTPISDITIPTLGSPRNYGYPVEYFYDTIGHLTKIGRAARTDQLIQDLSRVIEQPIQAQ